MKTKLKLLAFANISAISSCGFPFVLQISSEHIAHLHWFEVVNCISCVEKQKKIVLLRDRNTISIIKTCWEKIKFQIQEENMKCDVDKQKWNEMNKEKPMCHQFSSGDNWCAIKVTQLCAQRFVCSDHWNGTVFFSSSSINLF